MIIHTYPVNDIFDHIIDGSGCWCSPTTIDHDGNTQVVHNSLDGREHTEPDHDWGNCSICLDALS